jgi:hypothetical protein
MCTLLLLLSLSYSGTSANARASGLNAILPIFPAMTRLWNISPDLEGDNMSKGTVAKFHLNRRALCLALGMASLSGAALAQGKKGFDGTWGGADGDVTAQVIVSGNAVIGFFWRNDYLDASDAKLSADGSSLSFAFSGGHATLTRTGDATARIDITDGPRVVSMTLKRD